jgi:hypothetical protein
MKDSEIFRSDQAHEVTIPEGSRMAVAKTATPQGPSVKKNFKAEGVEEEIILPDKIISAKTEEFGKLPDKFVSAPETERLNRLKVPVEQQAEHLEALPVQIQVPTNLAKAPVIQASPAKAALPEVQAVAQASATAVDTSKSVQSAPAVDLPEMDFPARVVHLRIENEQLKSRLEKLEA